MNDQSYEARTENWEEMSVAVPMNNEDYEKKASEMGAVLQELAELEIKKSEITSKHKKVKERMESIASQIASKKISKKVPCMWLFNEKTKQKRLIAQLEDRTVYTVTDEPMTPQDFQIRLIVG